MDENIGQPARMYQGVVMRDLCRARDNIGKDIVSAEGWRKSFSAIQFRYSDHRVQVTLTRLGVQLSTEDSQPVFLFGGGGSLSFLHRRLDAFSRFMPQLLFRPRFVKLWAES